MSPTRLFAMCLSLFACKSESVDDVISKHRPAVEKTFAAIAALANAPDTASPLGAPAVPLVLEKPKSDEENAMFLYAEDLASPGATKQVTLRTLDSLPLAHCGSLLRGGTLSGSSEKLASLSVARGYLSACARVRFVLVIRSREFKAPTFSQGTHKFIPGRYQAEVQVFDLIISKSLGSFPVGAMNDANVTVVFEESEEQRILRNFEGSIYRELRAATKRAFPGALP